MRFQLPACLPILLERLRNEMTRLVTVKALTTIVNSPLKINLGAILPDVLPLLAEFLRKNQRALKVGFAQRFFCIMAYLLISCFVRSYEVAFGKHIMKITEIISM